MHIFQKYTELGLDNSVTMLETILKTLYTCALVGIAKVGKKTLAKRLGSMYYDTYVHIHNIENMEETIKYYQNETILLQKRICISLYYNKKYINQIVKLLKNTHSLHVIIIGNPGIATVLNSYTYIYRLKCPVYSEKYTELCKVSQQEFSHQKHVDEICKKYHTYHDCLLALELYEHDIYDIRSYSECVNDIVNQYVIQKKMTQLQLRNRLYNLIMHLSDFSEVILAFVDILLKSTKIEPGKMLEYASKCEHNFILGNKEVYHYEDFLIHMQCVYQNSKKKRK